MVLPLRTRVARDCFWRMPDTDTDIDTDFMSQNTTSIAAQCAGFGVAERRNVLALCGTAERRDALALVCGRAAQCAGVVRANVCGCVHGCAVCG